MATYLMTWNPRRWRWDNVRQEVTRVAQGQRLVGRWSCGNTQRIQKGDVLFFLRQGVPPLGIFGRGIAVSRCFTGPHFNENLRRLGRKAIYVRFRFDTLLDPESDGLLPRSALAAGALAKVHWNVQSSGTEIREPAASKLDEAWALHVSRASMVTGGADDEEIAAFEGTERQLFVRHRLRERRLRDEKIDQALKAKGNLRCEVPGCGFDFLVLYGEKGRGYAQVHHLTPLSKLSGATKMTLSDLAIVCANCHAMIHWRGECRPLEGLINKGGRLLF